MKKLCTALCLSVALAIPAYVSAQDRDRDDHRDEHHDQRIYDKRHNDYHEWNAHEDKAWHIYWEQQHHAVHRLGSRQ